MGKDFHGEELMPGHIQRPEKLSSGWENVRPPAAAGKSWEERDVQGKSLSHPTNWGFQGEKKTQIIPNSHPGLCRVSPFSEPDAKAFNEVN